MERISHKQLEDINSVLGDRDKNILLSVRKCKYLTSTQIRRLHFLDSVSELAAQRAANRNLKKLSEYGLLKPLKRRIGGVRSGSSALIWHITNAGEQLLHLNESGEFPRKRFFEPSQAFLRHTLAISECFVQLTEICNNNKNLSLSAVNLEPACWRPYNRHGKIISLKPDMSAVTLCDKYEDKWFFEIDLDTESPIKVVEKCDRYHEYYRTGLEQKQYGVFPITVWIVPTESRKESLLEHIKSAFTHQNKLFVVITPDELENLITQGINNKNLC